MKTEIIGIKLQPSHNGRVDGAPGNGVGVNNDLATAIRNGADSAQVYSKVVERYAMFFERPEARLRFLNNTLSKQADRQDRLQRRFRRFRFLERTRLYGWILEARCYSAILEEMRAMSSSLPRERRKLPQRVQAPFSARLLFLLHQTRHAFYGAAVILTGLAALCFYALGSWSWGRVNLILAEKYKSGQPVETSIQLKGGLDDVLNKTKHEKVWLVGKEGEYEKWSNGCRISTRYETDNHPRAYYTFPRGTDANGDQVSKAIVGIVYHTPESDIVDFTPKNSKAIQKRTLNLLEYVRERRLYNYMITRIGDIYRIVRDEHAAKHAGESLWGDEKNTYVSLNESFLGVCFESKFDGASSLDQIVTEAQIFAGRLLTDALRSEYNISDANCTTHGLVAVDEDKMLIARHHDWVSNFPFEAMGLSNKYKVQPLHMTDYGFTYDEDVLKKIGHNLWEGAVMAEEEFNRRAAATRVTPDALRRRMRDRYISQRNKTYGLRPKPADPNNPQLPEKSFAAGESPRSGASQSTSAAWKAAN